MSDSTKRPGPAPSPDPDAPRGYASREDKGGFLAKVWVAVVTGLVFQLVIPMIVMFLAMHSVFDSVGKLDLMDPSRSAYWQGALWMLETGPASDDGRPRPAKLARWVPSSDDPPSEAGIPPMYEPSLVAAGGSLWVIGADTVIEISGSGTRPVRHGDSLGQVSRPFAFRGRPALIERGPERYLLRVFDGERWIVDEGLTLGPASPDDDIASELLTVIDGPAGAGAVTAYDGALYYLPDLARLGAVPVADWERIADWDLHWSAGLAGADPVVVTTRGTVDLEGGITGYRRRADGWRQLFDIDRGVVGRLGVHGIDDGGRVLLLAEGLPGSITAWELDGDRVVRKTKIGGEGPNESEINTLSWISNAVGWITTLVLVILLSGTMTRHRTTTHLAAGATATYATLLRRALAAGIDLSIVAAPVAAIWFGRFGTGALDMEEVGPLGLLSVIGFMGVSVVWLLLWVAAFAFMEGRGGQTPGKRVAGIRVLDVDLVPCGFGRALIRNLLKVFADSLFNFFVGMTMIAFTPAWQRVGDLAARTVVVRVGTVRGGVPGPLDP
jgi:uncharacterized RDD family membrane protein YckC